MGRPWTGFDLDGTTSYYDHNLGLEPIGRPIPAIVALIQAHLAEGHDVRIVTARVAHDGSPKVIAFAERQRRLVQAWCTEHIGHVLPVVSGKDFDMVRLYDDRAIQVITNTGVLVLPQA